MDTVLSEVGRQTLQLSYPDEVDEVEAALRRFRGNARRRPKPPVGMGVELLPLADYVIPVLAGLFGIASGRIAERATDALTDRTRALLAELRDRPGPGAGPMTPEQEREVFESVLLSLEGKVSPEEAQRVAHGVIGALRMRSTGR
ncbi:hypothetical protein Aca07nite_86580 [Actinoplanes capillaceus]|uniref:Uncharacterized protein n=1 Tax=Actinoplanes campanulatus TaxID=113559 RepID=A0ABQ3WYX7_9ACTN|nr:hypothetical protein [Actinoplanes capillaceus]GID51383.1 hypothetical protein Aca07nite_86580 [Actinoplanes capillaceus]